ncbi:hypothetical protein ACG873_06695 [Mesorhizobium sp. AaZ16]|uniref:hypothetical protein n=1 Tax=Mesorhizobium sp. AaZ16 TaxID=3402289 RepID=UPI00374EBEC2
MFQEFEGRGGFQFGIGEYVDHCDGGFLAVVHARTKARLGSGVSGPELYTVELLAGPIAGECRMMLGDALVSVADWRPPGGCAPGLPALEPHARSTLDAFAIR